MHQVRRPLHRALDPRGGECLLLVHAAAAARPTCR